MPLPATSSDGRFRLRVAFDDDAERWWEAMHDQAQLALGLPAFVDPPDLEGVRERVAEARSDTESCSPGTLVLADVEDDRFLAGLSWRLDLPVPFRTADVGYFVHPAERRRGVATAGVSMLVRWLVEDADGPRQGRVQLDHSVENPWSCRVAVAAGLPVEGVRRGYLPLRDPDAEDGVRRHDVCLHGRAFWARSTSS